MTTKWKWKMYLFVRKVDVTAGMKTTFATILSVNGSMETIPNEEKTFDSVLKYSSDGELPATVFGFSLPVKASMRSALKTFIESLPNSRYAVTANTRLDNYFDGELILTTFNVTPDGQIVDQEAIDNFLNNEFGLNRIPEPEEEILTSK